MTSARRSLDPRMAFELLPEAFLLLDAGGNALAANAAARRTLGMDAPLPDDGYPLQRLGAHAARLADALRQPGAEGGEFSGSTAGNVYEVREVPVLAPDGELLIRIVRLADVSAARRESALLEAARKALAERVRTQTDELHALAARLEDERSRLAGEAERLQVVESVAGIGHWIWRRERDELEFSPNARRLLGMPEEASIGDGALASEPGYAPLVRQFERIRAGLEAEESRITLYGADGEPRHLVGTLPVPLSEDGRVVCAIGLIQDVTERERAAVRLLEQNRELELEVEAGTRELLDIARQLEGFAYMATHELRAPLRAINGHATIALEEHAGALSAASLEALGEIARRANRLDGMIDDLRVLASRAGSALAPARLDIAPLARRCMAEYRASGIELECAPSVFVEADPVLMPILLRHLLSGVCERALPLRARVRVGLDGQRLVIGCAALGEAPAAEPLRDHLLRAAGMRLQWQPGELRLDARDVP